ncbi:MAG: NAD(P)-dependent glycerol-3-phosphate dehydrogenase [Rhodobacteraceae bacterium]|nr:NAD(P)-dependent glycerol-3-phosphate dehydrogenase [Paracoccaceae bacterium]
MSRIGVIGAGAFGTGLGCAIARAGHEVVLWGRDGAQVSRMQETGRNDRYLPEVMFPATLMMTANFDELKDLTALLVVVPAQQLRGFLQEHDLALYTCPIVFCAKGLETGTGMLQTQIAQDQQITAPMAVISGPGFAGEIAQGKPTALSIACADSDMGQRLQAELSSASLRLYLTNDIAGVQLGGALKNVYAIACGIVVGADLGESARAALLTRGFAEMSRLAQALGAKAETLAGLSGFGDLALTCTSPQSRNFAFGAVLARSGDFGTGTTVEGIATARAVVELAKNHGIEMPIARVVADVLEKKLTVPQALKTLMARPLKKES